MKSSKPTKVEATQIVLDHLPLLNAPVVEVRDIRKIALSKYKIFSVHFDTNVHLVIYANSFAELDKYLKKNHYSTGLVHADTNLPLFPSKFRGMDAWAARTTSYHITHIAVYLVNTAEMPLHM